MATVRKVSGGKNVLITIENKQREDRFLASMSISMDEAQSLLAGLIEVLDPTTRGFLQWREQHSRVYSRLILAIDEYESTYKGVAENDQLRLLRSIMEGTT